ncbi:MAG: uroporphyrinogen decarboxylase family protein [Promethearchaeota archaeon]
MSFGGSKIDALKGLLYGKGLRLFKLNPDSRLVAAMMGIPDYAPLVSAQIHVHTMTVAGADPYRFLYEDGSYMADVQLNVQKWYGFENPYIMPAEGYNYEVEALGGKMVRSRNHPATIDQSDPLIKKPEDIDKVKVPIEKDWGRVKYVIEFVKRAGEISGTPFAIFCAPFSFLCGIHSYPRVIYNIKKNPDFYNRLMQWSVDEVLIPYMELLHHETGAERFMGADAWAVIPNVTKEIIEQFILPWNIYLNEQAKARKLNATVDITGDYCEDNPARFDPELMKWCWSTMGDMFGVPYLLMGMGKPELWPMEVMQEFIAEEKARGRKVMVAATCSASYIRDSTPYEIAEYVKRVMDALGRDGGLMFSLVQVPADTPPINVHSYAEAVRLYGKYPVPEDLDEIEFRAPEFEPYQDWLQREIAEGRVEPYE